MRLLLDTHLLLWAAGAPQRLPPAAHELIADPDNELYFSAASLWEIAIKHALDRLDFRTDPRLLRSELLDHGYLELPVNGEHATLTALLPRLHKDPFDRLLIAQASAESLTLLTHDATLARYPGPVQLV